MGSRCETSSVRATVGQGQSGCSRAIAYLVIEAAGGDAQRHHDGFNTALRQRAEALGSGRRAAVLPALGVLQLGGEREQQRLAEWRAGQL